MTIRVMADTHAIEWHLYNDPRLSATAKAHLLAVEAAGDQVTISSITLAEFVYLVEKGRVDGAMLRRIAGVLDHSSASLIEIPVDRAVVTAMAHLPRADVPDLPDRLIAATALMLGVPVVSRDRKIRS